jgi:hypothetical protein
MCQRSPAWNGLLVGSPASDDTNAACDHKIRKQNANATLGNEYNVLKKLQTAVRSTKAPWKAIRLKN